MTKELSMGLQEGDTCIIATDCNQRIYVKAVKTSNGYARIEIELPDQFTACKFRRREISSDAEDS